MNWTSSWEGPMTRFVNAVIGFTFHKDRKFFDHLNLTFQGSAWIRELERRIHKKILHKRQPMGQRLMCLHPTDKQSLTPEHTNLITGCIYSPTSCVSEKIRTYKQ
jgi:hypothetical protein